VNDVSQNPNSLDVLLTISSVRLLFSIESFFHSDEFFRFDSIHNRYTLDSVSDDTAQLSFLETVRPLLSLPDPGTSPRYGQEHVWIDDTETDETFRNCVEHSTCQIASVTFVELIEGI
jgi:hypothetical protein